MSLAISHSTGERRIAGYPQSVSSTAQITPVGRLASTMSGMDASDVVQRIDMEPWMRFPDDPAEAGFADLAGAAERARHLATDRSSWALGDNGTLPDAGIIFHECQLARATGSARIDIHRRDRDGTELIEPDCGRDSDAVSRALHLGGGLVLRDADRISPSLNMLAGWLAVAIGAPVEVVALFGSEPLRRAFTGRRRSWVATVNSEVIVHEPSRPPIEVEPMSVVECAVPPRVLGGAVSFTIVVMERVPTAAERARLVAQRAGLHPLLRADVPSDLDVPIDLGGEGMATYTDIFAGELASARSSLNESGILRAWQMTQARWPVPVPLGADPLMVRGLVPGGVGVVNVIEQNTQGLSGDAAAASLVVVAGGHAFAIPHGEVPTVERLVGGEPFEVPVNSAAGVAALVFAEAGLAVVERPSPATS